MPQVEFTSQLAQLAQCPAVQSVEAETLSAALDCLFSQYDQLQQNVLDGDGAIHSHLAVFVDGQMIERNNLAFPVNGETKIFVMQALSGG